MRRVIFILSMLVLSQTSVAEDMASMEGGKFVLKHVSEHGDDFIKDIAKFESKIDDVGNFTTDIMLSSGKKPECKSWKQSTFNTPKQSGKETTGNAGLLRANPSQ